MITSRYARANNEGMGELFDPTKPTSTIKGLDANNLYGWAMSQPLPDGQFYWVPLAELEAIKWEEQKDEQEVGYILQVDLDYPAELHALHNDLALAPERVYVQNEWFSEKQVFLRAQYNLPRTDFNAKLIPNLMNKKKYTVDYRLLKFYIQHGMILRKIHRGVKYHQRPWMAPYIAINQELRKHAKTPFAKDLFKLMNNSVFGKTCENQKKTHLHPTGYQRAEVQAAGSEASVH